MHSIESPHWKSCLATFALTLALQLGAGWGAASTLSEKQCLGLLDSLRNSLQQGELDFLYFEVPEQNCGQAERYEMHYWKGLGLHLIEQWELASHHFFEAIELGGPKDEEILERLKSMHSSTADTALASLLDSELEARFSGDGRSEAWKERNVLMRTTEWYRGLHYVSYDLGRAYFNGFHGISRNRLRREIFFGNYRVSPQIGLSTFKDFSQGELRSISFSGGFVHNWRLWELTSLVGMDFSEDYDVDGRFLLEAKDSLLEKEEKKLHGTYSLQLSRTIALSPLSSMDIGFGIAGFGQRTHYQAGLLAGRAGMKWSQWVFGSAFYHDLNPQDEEPLCLEGLHCSARLQGIFGWHLLAGIERKENKWDNELFLEYGWDSENLGPKKGRPDSLFIDEGRPTIEQELAAGYETETQPFRSGSVAFFAQGKVGFSWQSKTPGKTPVWFWSMWLGSRINL